MQPANNKPVEPNVTALYTSEIPVQGCDDGDLAVRVAAGDSDAGEELVRRHQAAVRGFLRAVCYDRQAVDDLAQDTFLRAIKHASRFNPRYPMRGWLLTIARRLSINHGDKQKRRRPAPGIELNDMAHAQSNEPGLRMEQDEQLTMTRETINRALHRLSEPHRVAIVMHYQQGLALEEIAGLLEMPVGTVKSHLHRGRRRMRELLEPQAERLLP